MRTTITNRKATMPSWGPGVVTDLMSDCTRRERGGGGGGGGVRRARTENKEEVRLRTSLIAALKDRETMP